MWIFWIYTLNNRQIYIQLNEWLEKNEYAYINGNEQHVMAQHQLDYLL